MCNYKTEKTVNKTKTSMGWHLQLLLLWLSTAIFPYICFASIWPLFLPNNLNCIYKLLCIKTCIALWLTTVSPFSLDNSCYHVSAFICHWHNYLNCFNKTKAAFFLRTSFSITLPISFKSLGNIDGVTSFKLVYDLLKKDPIFPIQPVLSGLIFYH